MTEYNFAKQQWYAKVLMIKHQTIWKICFTYVRDSHSRTTRSSVKNDLYFPTGKHKELYIQSFIINGANICNSINPDIRNQQSLNSFKNTYIKDNFCV